MATTADPEPIDAAIVEADAAARGEAHLVRRAADGDASAFAELVRGTRRDAHALALRLTGDEDDAADVVQDAYLRAYRGLPRFRGDARFGTWLYRIVANCASTHLGRSRRDRHDGLDEAAPMADPRPDHDPALRGDVVDLRDSLAAAVRDLPPGLRAVVVLRDVHDLPHDQVAAELGISVSATKVRLHRARRRLRTQVLPLPGEEADRAG